MERRRWVDIVFAVFGTLAVVRFLSVLGGGRAGLWR